MGTAAIVGGSLAAALLAYGFQVFGGRVLGPEAFAPITVLWTVQFLAMQVLYQPLEHIVNREAKRGVPPSLGPALLFGAGNGALSAGVIFAMGDAFGLNATYAVLTGVMVFGYTLFGYTRGRMAGAEQFVGFGIVTASEALLRLLAAVALVFTFRALGLAWAMALAPFVALPWLRRSGTRGVASDLTRTLTPLIAAAVFAQALLGLAPLAAGAIGASAAMVSVVFMTFAMYRGPLWILQGVMARLMPVFVDHVEDGARAALRRWVALLSLGGTALAAVAFIVGSLLGPPVFELLLGAAFRPEPVFSGLVAAGVILAACGGLLNQLLLAMDALMTITAMWLLGFVAAAVAVFAAPFAPDLVIGEAFVIGELVALYGLTGGAFLLLRREVVPVPDTATVADAVGV